VQILTKYVASLRGMIAGKKRRVRLYELGWDLLASRQCLTVMEMIAAGGMFLWCMAIGLD
jgi:hypothetical protein